MLSILSRNSASGQQPRSRLGQQPRSRPRPPTCSICSMMGHNRRGCHLNQTHMNGESINLIRYRSNDRTHRNILAQQRQPPQQHPPTLSSRIQNELSNTP